MSLALALAALGLTAALPAAADPEAAHAGFTLVQRDCPALEEHALRELVELELRTLSESGSGVRVEIACSGEVAAVSLTDAEGRAYPIAARVDFARAGPGARERLVALATTELVAQADHGSHASTAEAAPAKPPALHTPPAPPELSREAKPARVTEPEARVEVSLMVVGTLLGSPTTPLAGGALGARVQLAGPWAAVFDVRVERGTTDTDVARVTWTMLGGSAALHFEHRFGIARFGAGAGIRAARLGLEPSVHFPDRGEGVSGTWLGPVIPVRGSLALTRHLAAVVTVEAGYITLPVRGTTDDGGAVVEADGPWASAGLGLAAAF
jgi:hypothetical protein